jgi:hypothetical protein
MPIQGNPVAPLVGGTNVQDVLQGYVFQSGIHKPEHSSILTYKYPQYYLTSLLDRMGAEETVTQDVFSWNVMDRTRKGSTVIAIDTALPAASVVMDTNFDYVSGAAEGYLIVGDLIRIESGAILRVTATGTNGAAKQEITVVNQAGGNITAVNLQSGDAFGHVGSAFGEGSSAPDGRLYLPVEEYNRTHISRRSFSISGSELTNKIYLNDGESWFFEVEDINMKEFAKDKEVTTLFGVLSDTGVKSTRGIWDYASTYGVFNEFAAATGVSEDDIMGHVKDLLIQNVSNEIFVLCGAQFLHDFQKSLRDYAIQGAISYGAFGDNTAGLDFHRYKFMGKTVNIAYYELFDDESVVPTPVNGINNTTRANFSNTSLWLDFGSENNGRSLITMKYKSHGGVSRKFIHGYVNGMVGYNGQTGGNMANADDKFSVNMLSEFGVEVRLPNRLGILRATS